MKRNHRVGLRFARQGLPDVVMLHIIRLQPAALDLLMQLRAISPAVAVLVLTKEQLLQRVWEGRARDTNIVEVYIKQLRQKLEEQGEPRLIHTIREVGYVLRAAHRDPADVTSSESVRSTSSVPQEHP